MLIQTKLIRKLIPLHLLMIAVFMFAGDIFGLPHGIFYLLDLLLCVEFLWVPYTLKETLRRADLWQVVPYFVIYTAFLLLTQILQEVSPGLVLMSYRRIYRFYVFFAVCIAVLELADVDRILRGMLLFQIPNTVLSLYQFLVQKVPQDNIGGIFGTVVGVNAYTNIYLCVICAYVLVAYFSKKGTMLSVALVCGSSLLIAAIAELKLFFVEIAAIAVLAILFSRLTVRTLKIMGIGVVGFSAALLVFAKLYPEHMAILTNPELFKNYTTGVTMGYNISRLNAFGDINRIFFKGDLMSNLFGYGFGNCESGSAFYELYSEYHYTWFTHQVTFLETGYVGLVLYAMFYVLVYFHAGRSKKLDPDNRYYYVFTQIICMLSAFWILYNQAMRMEPAYLIFFTLAVPAIVRKSQYQREIGGKTE